MGQNPFPEERPEVAPPTEGEVVSVGASETYFINAFIQRIKENVKEAYNIWYNPNLGTITLWLGDIFVKLEPQFGDNNQLIYTTIQLEWTDNQLRPLAKLYISSTLVEFEDGDRTLTFKYTGKIEEDPIILTDENELFEYLNELANVEDFIAFAEKEFKSWSGLP
jgi:hypothetical protein